MECPDHSKHLYSIRREFDALDSCRMGQSDAGPSKKQKGYIHPHTRSDLWSETPLGRSHRRCSAIWCGRALLNRACKRQACTYNFPRARGHEVGDGGDRGLGEATSFHCSRVGETSSPRGRCVFKKRGLHPANRDDIRSSLSLSLRCARRGRGRPRGDCSKRLSRSRHCSASRELGNRLMGVSET